MKKTLLSIFAFVLYLLLNSCTQSEKQKVTVSFVEFSTDVSITVFNVRESQVEKVKEILYEAENIFKYFNSEMNVYEPGSTLSKFNDNANAVKEVPKSLRKIFSVSGNIYKYTDRSFDIAIQPVVELWGFNTVASTPSKPDSCKIKEVLIFSNFDRYRFFNDSVLVTDNRCKIGLGGIAKGYAADSTGTYLISKGLNDFIVAVGGDVLVGSETPKTVGIRHPRKKGEVIDTLYISGKAISTSGDYEKYFEEENTRYCHIIDPSDGYGTSDMISASVISEKSYMSDAFATAVFVMGREKGRYFIEKNNLSGIIYYFNENGDILSDEINLEKYKRKNSMNGNEE
ncbi:MAG TPA: FAD:protein FMN transferase [Clostridiales bacterium]|nr:FAD:protein FMN transferase [Clostridiales bacterium]HQP69599.1 FAD:protein FMN transferase [Clostridiales bacterium]